MSVPSPPSAAVPKQDARSQRALPEGESQVFRDEDKLSVAIESSMDPSEMTAWVKSVLGPIPSGDKILCCKGLPFLTKKPFLYRITLPNSALYAKLLSASSSQLSSRIISLGPWSGFPATGTLLVPLLCVKQEAVRKAIATALARWSGMVVTCQQGVQDEFLTGCWHIKAVFPTPKTRPLKPVQVVIKVKSEDISCTLHWDTVRSMTDRWALNWKLCAKHWWGKRTTSTPLPNPLPFFNIAYSTCSCP